MHVLGNVELNILCVWLERTEMLCYRHIPNCSVTTSSISGFALQWLLFHKVRKHDRNIHMGKGYPVSFRQCIFRMFVCLRKKRQNHHHQQQNITIGNIQSDISFKMALFQGWTAG